MASDQASSGADRHGSSETGRPDDPWQRIETEKPQRDAARKAWDAQHDPSPEYEYAIRPLSEDYGKDRPANRDLTEAQRQELAEVFGRPADELLALRDKDPRAAHNRDDQGHILDHNGNPRPDKPPEHILREAQRQANLYGPAADTPDRQAPSDRGETGTSGKNDDKPAGVGVDSPRPFATDDEDEPPEDLDQLLGRITVDMRDGKLTTTEAAHQLEAFRDRIEPTMTEPTTEIVREQDGYRYERGAESELPEEVVAEDLSKLTELRRIAWRRSDDVHDALDQGIDNAFELMESIEPTGTEQRQPGEIAYYDQSRQGADAGDAATAAMVVAVLAVEAVRLGAHRLGARRRDMPA